MENNSRWGILVGVFTIVGAIAAILVVPEFRDFIFRFPETEILTEILTVEARRERWTEANFEVQKGNTIKIDASGLIDYGGLKCGPDGNPNHKIGRDVAIANEYYGALIGKIGMGAPFMVGSHFQGVATESGKLAFLVNDSIYDDNSGPFQVNITILKKQ